MAFRQRVCSSILRPARNNALLAGRRPLALSFSTTRLARAAAAEDTSKGVVCYTLPFGQTQLTHRST